MKHKIALSSASTLYVRDLLRACVAEAERAAASSTADPDEKRFHADVSNRATRINRLFIRADDAVTLDDDQLGFVGGLLSTRGLELSRAYGQSSGAERDRLGNEMDLRRAIVDQIDRARAADTSQDPEEEEEEQDDEADESAPPPSAHTR